MCAAPAQGVDVVTLLLDLGFLGGLVTGISPCILPVLPVISASGAASGLDEDAAVQPPVTTRVPSAVTVGSGR